MSLVHKTGKYYFRICGIALPEGAAAGVHGESNTQLRVRTLMCACAWRMDSVHIIDSLYQLIVNNSFLEVFVDS